MKVPKPDGDEWLVIHDGSDVKRIAFQKVEALPPPTWPDGGMPQQLHLDLVVSTKDDLAAQHARVLAMGGRMLLDRSDDEQEPLYVYADPAGHPFCIFVG
jgi:hypothetical protein